MKGLGKEIIVYQCGTRDDGPFFAIARTADEIPLDADGQRVGVYVLSKTFTFNVRRELK